MAKLSRRQLLATGSTAGIAVITGCQSLLGSDDHELVLQVANYTDEPQEIHVDLLDPDSDDYDSAHVLQDEFSAPVAPGGSSAGTTEERFSVPRQQYYVRTALRNEFNGEDHYHFYPGTDSGSDQTTSHLFVRIYRREETGRLYTRFN